MLKNMRVTSRIASTTSAGLLRSATITSAPSSRNRFPRASPRRTTTRTGSPLARNTSTTESLTVPEAQAARVIRYIAVNLVADVGSVSRAAKQLMDSRRFPPMYEVGAGVL